MQVSIYEIEAKTGVTYETFTRLGLRSFDSLDYTLSFELIGWILTYYSRKDYFTLNKKES